MKFREEQTVKRVSNVPAAGGLALLPARRRADRDILSVYRYSLGKGIAVGIDQPQRVLRKELRKLLPVNKDDVAAIEAITAHGVSERSNAATTERLKTGHGR